MDKSYLIQHASDRILELKNNLSNLNPQLFLLVDDFLIDIVCCNGNLWIKILDEEHDHTDSYFLEAQLQQIADKQGVALCFVEALDSLENNMVIIRQKLDLFKNNKN